jgi:putative DNA primase/helicase
VPDEPPALVGGENIIRAFHAVAQRPAPPAPQEKAPPARDDTVDQVKQRLDLVDVATKLYGEGNREGNEVRFPGNGGLLVNGEKQSWYCHQSAYGGDVLDLLCYHRYGSTLNGDKDRFKEVLQEAAGVAGVDMPPPAGPGQRQQPTRAHAPARDEYIAVSPLPLLPVDLPNETLAGLAEDLDKGDSELLAALYPSELRYDHNHKAWYFWNGFHWKKDAGDVMIRSILSSQVRSQYQRALIPLQVELGTLKDKTQKDDSDNERLAKLERWCKALGSRIKALGTTGGCKSVATFAQIYLSFNGHWNAQKTILPCRNGYVDLNTGALLPFNPLDYFTAIIPIDYKPDADAPLWQAFLDTVQPAKEMQAYLQTFAGYAATGVTEELCAFFVGSGANGKTTFCNVLAGVLGEGFSTELNPEALMEVRGQKSYDLANVENARLVVAREMRNGTLATNTFKQLVDIGKLNIERKYEQPYTIERTHSLIVYANATPRITDTTNGTWRRLHLVEWAVSIPDNQRVTNYHNHILNQDAEGVLAWLVRGAVMYLSDGIQPTSTITQATNELRQSEDEIGGFLAACCVTSPTAYVPSSVLYEAYAEYVQAPTSQRVFGKEIVSRFGTPKTIRINGKPTRCFQGIGLLTDGDVTLCVTSEEPGFSPSESPKPHPAMGGVTDVTDVTIKFHEKPLREEQNEKFSVTSVTSVTNATDVCDLALESPKPPQGSCVTSVTRQEAAAARYREEDYRLALLARLVRPDTGREERARMYAQETSELEALVYSALVGEGKIAAARKLADQSSEPTAMHGFIDALLETIETA